MALPFTIDNQTTCAADALRELLDHGRGCPVDIASAYFSISGWELLSEGLRGVGALRLLLGSEPGSGGYFGLTDSARKSGCSLGTPVGQPSSLHSRQDRKKGNINCHRTGRKLGGVPDWLW
jgi:hypothetical protein